MLKEGNTAIDIYIQYKKNKQKCGRKLIQLPQDEIDYINEKVGDGRTPDIIIGRKDKPVSWSVKTLYRMFKKGILNPGKLPMKGRIKPNGHQEKSKQAFKRGIKDCNQEHPNDEKDFSYLKGDTIVGSQHKSAVISLVERISNK